MAWKIPLADVRFGPEELEAVNQVIASGWLSQGPVVQSFEAAFARFIGAKYAFAVANGTAALHLACQALELGPGDEVLCPALTFVASANAILYTGARPAFVDIKGPHDLNLCVKDAEQKITPRTKAVMVVHYAGFPADMAAVQELAGRHGLCIIEDCAHAPGACHADLPGAPKVGTRGTVACFSFFSNKNMTTGEGGMVVTDDEGLAERLRIARSHGMTSLTWDRYLGHNFSYDVVAQGYNYRLDDLRAALGLVQLARLEAANQERRRLTLFYREKLQELGRVEIPFLAEKVDTSSCHIFPILLPTTADRSRFMAHLAESGIQTSIHYPPVHNFTYYRQIWPAAFDHRLPRTEEVARREVTLPLFPTMSTDQAEEVVRGVREFFQKS
ncbi:MAG: DegT/DnrJ/EryC1/StrS family aminotransferase [Deltaproteobacteria bacterium]|nr:DegT/DnrJ/EryC1/StrS family aminotransferase [Deltaproteobacteria bacterium]